MTFVHWDPGHGYYPGNVQSTGLGAPCFDILCVALDGQKGPLIRGHQGALGYALPLVGGDLG